MRLRGALLLLVEEAIGQEQRYQSVPIGHSALHNATSCSILLKSGEVSNSSVVGFRRLLSTVAVSSKIALFGGVSRRLRIASQVPSQRHLLQG